MPLTAGTRLGHYDIIAAIGAGAMGEVYRARDTRLARDVALKILPDAFAVDADRLARFEREAHVLASLNHANVAHVYGVERAGATYALAMELVEGDDLSQRIARGALPLEDVLAIAGQIADALEAAHERGIVHRDLKPANIKVRDDGTVKVLDFGLAKASAAAFVGQSLNPQGAQDSPTIMSPAMTQQGVILGTPGYMAPEQAKGRTVDRRADVWAFGCILYEMLTGKRAFRGEDVTDTLAAIVRAQPDWSALPAGTPASVRRLLRRCLEKETKHRLGSMGDARLELEEREDVSAPVTSGPLERRVRPWLLAAAALAGAAVTALAFVAFGAGAGAPQHRPSVRLSLAAPLGTTFSGDPADVALSPDGRALAFTTITAAGVTSIWVRPLDSLDARPLAGTEGGRLPFWSPDSTELAYFADGTLKKVSVAGGVPQVICDAESGRGGTWSRESGIVLAPLNNGPLFRVSPDGGELSPVTTLDSAAGEIGHRFPSFLGDGRTFLFAAMPPKSAGRHQIFAAAVGSTERTFVLETTGVPVYAEPGYLLFSRDTVILAQRFDVQARTLTGDAQNLGDIRDTRGRFVAARPVSVSSSGAFAYMGGTLADSKVALVDRSGREHGVVDVPPGPYSGVSLAPDGRRLALVRSLTTFGSDVWLADMARPGASRFTFGGALNTGPVWSADGRRIAFAQAGTGARNLMVRPSDGSSPEEPLFVSPAPFKDAFDWSPDGQFVVMGQLDQKTRWDLWMLPVSGDRTPQPYLQTPANEINARISPDGRWLAYVSDETGRNEVYVQSFPAPGTRYQVTTQGSGEFVRWRGDGRELAMLSGDGQQLLTAEVEAGPALRTAPPRRLMSLPRRLDLDITRDFQRVVILLPAEDSTPAIVVVTDWLTGLAR